MGEEAVRLGVALSEVDAARVVEADVAMVKIGESISGVANAIAITLAPFAYGGRRPVHRLDDQRHPDDQLPRPGRELGTTAVGGLADIVQVFATGFYAIRAVFDEVFSLGSKALTC